MMKILPCPKCGSEGKLVYVMDMVGVCCTNDNCRHVGNVYNVYNVWADHSDTAPINAIEDWNEEERRN